MRLMSRGRYKLQPVLDVRERAKTDAAKVVAARRAQLEEAEAELARRESSLALCRERQREARAKMLDETQAGAEASRHVAYRTHLTDLRRQEEALAASVEEQRGAVGRAERELDAALGQLAEASKEVRVIEKHREHWREDERLAERRREQKRGDEIAAALHRRGGAGSD